MLDPTSLAIGIAADSALTVVSAHVADRWMTGRVGDFDSTPAFYPPPTTRACSGVPVPGRVTRVLECQGCARYQQRGADRDEPPAEIVQKAGRLYCPNRLRD